MPPQPIPATSTAKKNVKGAPKQPAYNPLSGGSANAGNKAPTANDFSTSLSNLNAKAASVKKKKKASATSSAAYNPLSSANTSVAKKTTPSEVAPEQRRNIPRTPKKELPDVGKSEPVAQRRLSTDLIDSVLSGDYWSEKEGETWLPGPGNGRALESWVQSQDWVATQKKYGIGNFAPEQNNAALQLPSAQSTVGEVLAREKLLAQSQSDTDILLDFMNRNGAGSRPAPTSPITESGYIPRTMPKNDVAGRASYATVQDVSKNITNEQAPLNSPVYMVKMRDGMFRNGIITQHPMYIPAQLNPIEASILSVLPLDSPFLSRALSQIAMMRSGVEDPNVGGGIQGVLDRLGQLYTGLSVEIQRSDRRAGRTNQTLSVDGWLNTMRSLLENGPNILGAGVQSVPAVIDGFTGRDNFGESIRGAASALGGVLISYGALADSAWKSPLYMPLFQPEPDVRAVGGLGGVLKLSPADHITNTWDTLGYTGGAAIDYLRTRTGEQMTEDFGGPDGLVQFLYSFGDTLRGSFSRSLNEKINTSVVNMNARAEADIAKAIASGNMEKAAELTNLRKSQAWMLYVDEESRLKQYGEVLANGSIEQAASNARKKGIEEFNLAMAIVPNTLEKEREQQIHLHAAAKWNQIANQYQQMTPDDFVLDWDSKMTVLDRWAEILAPDALDIVPAFVALTGIGFLKTGQKAAGDAAKVSGVAKVLDDALDRSYANAAKAADPNMPYNPTSGRFEGAFDILPNTIDDVFAISDEEAKALLAAEIDKTKLGRKVKYFSNALGRAATSAASELGFYFIPAIIDVLKNVDTVEDARFVFESMKDTKKFLTGMGDENHIWSSELVRSATNNGAEKWVPNEAPFRIKQVQRAMVHFQKIIDEFLASSEALREPGLIGSKELLFQEVLSAVRTSASREFNSATALANMPYGTVKAVARSGEAVVDFVDSGGKVLRSEPAKSIADAKRIAGDANKEINGARIFRRDVFQLAGDLKRKAWSIPFIGWNPSNLIQQAANPLFLSITDGVSVFGEKRFGLRNLSGPGGAAEHTAKLYGVNDPTMRGLSGMDAVLYMTGGGVNKRATLAAPLRGAYQSVEEGMGARFRYDGMVKFIQKYGRGVVDDVIVPDLQALGLPPMVAQKVGNAFYDAAFSEGLAAGLKAGIDALNSSIVTRTVSDFDPQWTTYLPPTAYADLNRIMATALSPEDAVAKLDAYAVNARKNWEQLIADSPPVASRYSWTEMDTIQDLADLRTKATNAIRNGGDKAKIEAEYAEIVARQASMKATLRGLITSMEGNALAANNGIVYSIWKAMRDGRAIVEKQLSDLSEKIHLAGGKELWATEYYPAAREAWRKYIESVDASVAQAKKAIDEGDTSAYANSDQMISQHSGHTDDYLRNVLKLEPRSGLWDSTLRESIDAGRALERNQHARFASVAQQTKAAPYRVMDEMVSAERDVMNEGARIRARLDREFEKVTKEIKKTGNSFLINDYYKTRNAMWREFFGSYVPARWQAASVELVKSVNGNADEFIRSFSMDGKPVDAVRANDLRGRIRTALKDVVPSAREKKPTGAVAVVPDAAKRFVDVPSLKQEIANAISVDGTIEVRAAGRNFDWSEVADSSGNKLILTDGTQVDFRSIRKIVSTSLPDVGKRPKQRVVFSREGSPAWQAAAKKTPPITQTSPTVKMIQGIGNNALSLIYENVNGIDTVRGNGWFTWIARKETALAKAIFSDTVKELQRMYPDAAEFIRREWDKSFEKVNDAIRADNARTYSGLGEDALEHNLRAIKSEFDEGKVILGYYGFIRKVSAKLEEQFGADKVGDPFNVAMEAVAPKRFADYVKQNGGIPAAEMYDDFISEIYNGEMRFAGDVGKITRDNIAQKAKYAFGLSDRQAQTFAQVAEARARAWANMFLEEAGELFDEADIQDTMNWWYADTLQDIIASKRPGSIADIVNMTNNTAFAQVETKRVGNTYKMRDLVRVFREIDRYPEGSPERLQIAQHELFHVFNDDLIRAAESGNVRAQELSVALYEYVSDTPYVKGSNINWGTDELERLAVGFERYLRTGKAPTSKLAQVFEKFKRWFDGVVRWYKEYNDWWEETSKETGLPREAQGNIAYQIFDEMLGGRRAEIKPSTLPDVGQTTPNILRAEAPKGAAQGFDNAVMNALRKKLREIDPNSKILDGIKSLNDIDPRLLPFLDELARTIELQHGPDAAAASSALANLVNDYKGLLVKMRESMEAAAKDPNQKNPTAGYAALYAIENLDTLIDKMKRGVRSANASTEAADEVPAGASLKAVDYMRRQASALWDKVLYGANLAGDRARSYTMVDFWNKTRADDLMQIFFIFPFWRTRDIKNSMRRAAAMPGYLYHMERVKRELNRINAERENEPDRYNRFTEVASGTGAEGWLGEVFGIGGKMVDWSVLAGFTPDRFSPTIATHLGDPHRNEFATKGEDFFSEVMAGGSQVGLSVDPLTREILTYINESDAKKFRVSDWTTYTRIAAWTIIRNAPPEQWNSDLSKALDFIRPDFAENTIAREVANKRARGEIDDRTAAMAMDWLGQAFNGYAPSPEWLAMSDVERKAVFVVLDVASDSASAKEILANGTGLAVGVPIRVHDRTEDKILADQEMRSGLYYNPLSNDLGSSQAAWQETEINPGLQARDMQAGVTRSGVRPVVQWANRTQRNDLLALEERTTKVQQDAVSALLKVDPKATKTEMNQAKVKGLIPIAVEVLGKEATDAWLEAEFTSNNGKPSSNYVGLLKLIQDETKKATPSAFTDKAEPVTIPGTPKAEIASVLQHGSPWAQTSDMNAIKAYIDATDKLPSPVNPKILQQEYMQNAIYLVRDLYPYPDYDKVGAKAYARGAEQADQQRAEQLSKLLGIQVEEAAQLLEDYANRYMGEDEIARRGEIDAQNYGGGRGGGSWSRNYYRRYNRGWSSYRGRSYGGGGSWGGGGGGGGGGGDGQSDLLPSIEEYIRRQQRLSGALWRLPSSKYGVG